MRAIVKLRGSIQPYAWGSYTALAELLGRAVPSAEPEAELWMGTHPRAPSEVFDGGRWVPLCDTGVELPYLFKVLAVERPLSIQAHPDREQAIAGCRREDEAGLDRDAPERNYRDERPKPELVYALTPFAMLRGLRVPDEIRAIVERLGIGEHLGGDLARPADDGPERAVRAWMELDPARLEAAVAAVAGSDDELAVRIRGLAEAYPGDRGALAPIFLHLRHLRPGEAVFTGPGVLHAYLEGVGVELMTNSDNVLRAGLTGKHRDVPELLRILRFTPDTGELLEPEIGPGVRRFTVPPGLELTVLEPSPEGAIVCEGRRGDEVLLCTEGSGSVAGAGTTVACRQGEALFVPAAVASYRVEGEGRLFRAGVDPSP